MINDLLHNFLVSAQFYTTFDLADGYYQVELAEEDKEKTAFITEYGLFEFNVMPFGLTNAPATFQRVMNKALEGLLRVKCLSYIDDTITFSKSFGEHIMDVRAVCDALKAAQLKIRLEKCRFGQPRVEFLGHVVGRGVIMPAPSKVKAVAEFELPKTKRKLKGFLGLAGYLRKFIKNYGHHAAPLNVALAGKYEKNAVVEWTDAMMSSFYHLKYCLMTSKEEDAENGVLILPDVNKAFALMCDACDYGIGASLCQYDSQMKAWRPCEYYSKGLNRREVKYCTSEKELMVIVFGMQHFKHYLLDCKFVVIMFKPLLYSHCLQAFI